MSDITYQTILINKNGYGANRRILKLGAVFALMLVIFNIYFIYAAVDSLHALETDKTRLGESEYAYQESARAIQETLDGVGREIAEEGGFHKLGNSVFISRSSSLVLR